MNNKPYTSHQGFGMQIFFILRISIFFSYSFRNLLFFVSVIKGFYVLSHQGLLRTFPSRTSTYLAIKNVYVPPHRGLLRTFPSRTSASILEVQNINNKIVQCRQMGFKYTRYLLLCNQISQPLSESNHFRNNLQRSQRGGIRGHTKNIQPRRIPLFVASLPNPVDCIAPENILSQRGNFKINTTKKSEQIATHCAFR